MLTMNATNVQALFADVCAAWNRGDAHALAEHYAPDGRLINPFGEVADGREAIEAGFAQLFGGLLAGTSTEITVQNVRDVGAAMFIVDGTQTVTGPLPPLHVTAIVRQHGDRAEIIDCRPYAFLSTP